MRLMLVISLLLNMLLRPAVAQDPVSAAEDAASAFSSLAGSAELIRQRLSRPLLSGDLMQTPDGTLFAAKLLCPADDSFLEVLITPSASGDIAAVNIQQDTSMDGVLNRVFAPPFAVSGVCANGLISCTPGTWSDCRYYQWSADAAHNLNVLETAASTLGGCSCINNHCGVELLASNLESFVATVGAGAANALARQNPYFAITRSEIEGPLARYFGQDTAGCGAAGPSGLSTYFSNASNLSGDAATESSDNDVYQLITASPAASNAPLSTVSCDIRRSVTLDEVGVNDIIDYDGGSGAISPCGANCLQLVLGRIGNNYWGPSACSMFEHQVRFTILRPDRIRQAILSRAVWDDWIQVRANSDLIWSGPNPWLGSGNPPGACELKTSWDRSLNVDFSSALQTAGPVDFNVRVAVAGYGEGYAYARVNVDTSCRVNDDLILNNCQALQSNADCALQAETVDGVDTLRNFTVTGLSPLPSTVNLTGSFCSDSVSREWWVKQQRY